MGIEGAFAQLSQRLTHLREGLQQACIIFDDCPHSHSLVDQLCDAVQDVLGWVEEACAAAIAGHEAVVNKNDFEVARRKLLVCQKLYEQISRHAASVLFAYETHTRLKKLSRRQDDSENWHGWVKAGWSTISRLKTLIEGVQAPLAECWQEIATRAGNNNISIQNSNIGQHNNGSASTVL